MPKKTKKKSDCIPEQMDINLAEFKRLTGSHIVSSFILHYRQNLPNALEPLWKQIIDIPQLNTKYISEELYNQFRRGCYFTLDLTYRVLDYEFSFSVALVE